MLGLLKRAARFLLRRPRRGAGRFKEYRDLGPLKRVRGGNALNKAGRLLLRAKLGSRAVKIYEAASPAHAVFIERVSRHPDVRGLFPQVVARHGAFVVTDWVLRVRWQGRPRAPRGDRWLEELVTVQCRLHRSSLAGLPPPGFDYWHDFIWPRFVRAAELLGATDLAHDVGDRVGEAWTGSRPTLMHPDLTPANLVRSAPDGLTIIDNELLTIGGLPLLDICNTAYALGRERGQAYADLYLERANRRPARRGIEVLRGAWLARIVGSAFVAGRVPQAQAMVDRHRAGGDVLPVAFGQTTST